MISVIIATYNRSYAIKRVLNSFFQQNGLDSLLYELIVVDNNSSDDTRTVVDDFLRFSTVRYVFESKQGVSAARNRGVHESRGEIVAFLDDDVVVDRNWLLSLDKCFRETGADVVGGRSYLVFEETPPEWLGPEFRRQLAEVDVGDERKVLANGRKLFGLNLAIRTDVFHRKGGFSLTQGRMGYQLTTGEETALLVKIQRNGNKIMYDADVMVKHVIGSSRIQWDYFVALAHGVSKTRDNNEISRKRPYQCLRVSKSLLNCCWSFFSLIKTNLFTQSLYERKLAEFQFIVSKDDFHHRLKRLWL